MSVYSGRGDNSRFVFIKNIVTKVGPIRLSSLKRGDYKIGFKLLPAEMHCSATRHI